jgi:hypothetical protein
MTNTAWRTMASFINASQPATDQIREASTILFEDYTPEEIDKAMNIFHTYCQAVKDQPELTDVHKLNIYQCAGLALDACSSTAKL